MNTGSMSAKTACDVAVIGGGAAGMMAALQAAWAGARVALLEKNEKLGKKIYITGKGRCNVTNVADIDDFFKQIPRNPRFLNAAARQFTHEDVTGLLEMLGTPTKVERGGRVFPESDKASDVTRALDHGMRDAGVVISLNTQVAHVRQAEGGFDVELTQGGTLRAKSVIVATGGVSYPSTGSTGDGYVFAESAGHTVEKARACLCGLYLKGNFTALAGLSLKNIGYSVYTQGKKIYDDFGELLFTHKGVSGPVVLSSSSYISSMIAQGKNGFTVSIDLKPALDDKTLDKRVLKDFGIYKNKTLKNSLVDLMPRSLIPEVIRLAELDGEKSNSVISKEERTRLVNTIKDMRYEVTGLYPIEEAIVTGGGVNVKEISPSDMESKLVKGLRFAGEVLDVDALTGGFNLQCAFSTAFIAAKN